jgi:hypothetical protein
VRLGALWVLCVWAPAEGGERVPAPRLAAPWVSLEREHDEPRLEPMPDGRYRYEDRDAGFVAHVRPDGSVEFEPITGVTPPALAGPRAWLDGFFEALQRPAGQRDRPDLEAPMPLRDDASGRAFANAQLVPWGPYGAPPILLSLGMPLPGARKSPSKEAQIDFLRRTEGDGRIDHSSTPKARSVAIFRSSVVRHDGRDSMRCRHWARWG